MPTPAEIADPRLRQMLEKAHKDLNGGEYSQVVRLCADAYLEVLKRRPELLQGMGMMRPAMMWPRLGTTLVIQEDRPPEIKFDRQRFSFSEAVTYYEFALEQTIRATRAEI